MRQILLATVIALMPLTAIAQDYEKGLAAVHAGDYATALREWRPLAEQGHIEAQFNLGVLYTKGDGVPQDHAEALRWYREAAKKDYAPAQFAMGFAYARGDGVPKHFAAALRWYRLAAEQGNARAQANIGVMYANGEGVVQNIITAYMWFHIASENGMEAAADNSARLNKFMKAGQKAEAERRAKVCMESNYKDCD